jgi:hypothetical protein
VIQEPSSASPSEKIGGSGGTTTAADSSLLNDLHTLRSLAHDVKSQADSMRLWVIATQCAAISETATLAIDHYNATHTESDHGQANAGEAR